MSGRHRNGNNRHFRHRFWWRALHRTAAATALLFLVAEVAVVAVSSVRPQRAQAAQAPPGEGLTVTAGDLHFIMKQIKIAEHHSATLTASNPCGTLVGPGPDQIPDRLTPYGLRTVDGSCNNLFPQRERRLRPGEHRGAITGVGIDGNAPVAGVGDARRVVGGGLANR